MLKVNLNFFSFAEHRIKTSAFLPLAWLVFVLWIHACENETPERSMIVTVTAYNSVPSQTDSEPLVAAWGDRLKPGMKVVAVSRDLLQEGLSRGATLRIEGIEGEYLVLDKMATRFKRRVDIYMGGNVKKANQFGVRQLRIYWRE
jgi:3D (Asp-Asp-Asp) domain-containing protein